MSSWNWLFGGPTLSSVQSLSHVWLFATPWTTARQASLSITISRSLPKPMSIESVMQSSHLILCHPLLLMPSIFPIISVFSNESALCIRWPKYCSFSFSISTSNIQGWFPLGLSGLIPLQSVGLLSIFSSTTVRKHQFFGIQPLYGPNFTSTHGYWKSHRFGYTDFCQQSDVYAS